jgi:RNA polymerase-binding transcription factor DksA
MADLADQYQEDHEVYQKAAIDKKLAAIRAVPAGFDGVHCAACEEPVEPARLKLGLYVCIECARIAEIRRKTHA